MAPPSCDCRNSFTLSLITPDSRSFGAFLDTTSEEMSELYLLRVLMYHKRLDRGPYLYVNLLLHRSKYFYQRAWCSSAKPINPSN
jgi:hypothetical protein